MDPRDSLNVLEEINAFAPAGIQTPVGSLVPLSIALFWLHSLSKAYTDYVFF